MKKVLLLLALCCSVVSLGQNIDSMTLSHLKLNFVVPDMPAFKTLGTEPSQLLRPSTPQAFAVSVSEFYQKGAFALPQDFAMELTPSLLINAKKPVGNVIRTYSKAKWLKSFRVSIGTSADTTLSSAGRSMAIGIRSNIINKGDLATDAGYLEGVVDALGNFRLASRELLARFAHDQGIDTNEVDYELKITGNEALKAKFDLLVFDAEAQIAFMKVLDSLKQDYRKRNWNATKLDIAAALLTSAKDSLVENIRFNKLSFWSTLALRAGSSGQFLIGINTDTYRNLRDTADVTRDDLYANLSIPARLLIGTNRIKGFAEFQYQYLGHNLTNHTLFSLGAEVNPYDGIWINLYGGVDHNYNNSMGKFVTNLDIKVTLPEHFRFF